MEAATSKPWLAECAACHHSNPARAHFCNICGAALHPEAGAAQPQRRDAAEADALTRGFVLHAGDHPSRFMAAQTLLAREDALMPTVARAPAPALADAPAQPLAPPPGRRTLADRALTVLTGATLVLLGFAAGGYLSGGNAVPPPPPSAAPQVAAVPVPVPVPAALAAAPLVATATVATAAPPTPAAPAALAAPAAPADPAATSCTATVAALGLCPSSPNPSRN